MESLGPECGVFSPFTREPLGACVLSVPIVPMSLLLHPLLSLGVVAIFFLEVLSWTKNVPGQVYPYYWPGTGVTGSGGTAWHLWLSRWRCSLLCAQHDGCVLAATATMNFVVANLSYCFSAARWSPRVLPKGKKSISHQILGIFGGPVCQRNESGGFMESWWQDELGWLGWMWDVCLLAQDTSQVW